MSEYLPCPFCGEQPYILEGRGVSVGFTYAQCPAPVGYGPDRGHGTAGPMKVEAWNHRVPPGDSETKEVRDGD